MTHPGAPEDAAPAESIVADLLGGEGQATGYVVAVGASAGGLQALQRFFDNLPPDTGAAYVVLQHLSPDFKSVMDQLLVHHTVMGASIVAEDAPLRENHIHLLAPGKRMTIEGDTLRVADMESGARRFTQPISEFMRSLAHTRGTRAVGIVLSGTGSDGSQGVKAIHEAGGLVMVQDPAEAQFDGMPHNAIATGVADVVDSTPELARRLAAFVRRPAELGTPTGFRHHLAEHQDVLTQLLARLQRFSGIDFAGYKQTTVARRLEHRLGLRGIATLPEYLELVAGERGQEELGELHRDLLIGVTEFFRDADAFECVRREVVRRLLVARPENEPIRIWTVGCSSGEEAYSLAMLFLEEQAALDTQRDIKLFATDVDREAIRNAAAGVYPPGIAGELSDTRLLTFFQRLDSGEYQVQKFLRDQVIFAAHNVLTDPPFAHIDLVTCRNLLIYLQPHAQHRALGMMSFALDPGGFLFLGSAETPGPLSDGFRVLDYNSRVYEKTADTRRSPLSESGEQSPVRAPARRSAAALPSVLRPARDKSAVVQAAVDHLFDRCLPPTLVVNSDLQVLHSYGRLEPFLQPFRPGRMSNHLRDLLDPAIASLVLSAVHKAGTDGHSVLYEGGGGEDGQPPVNVRVMLFQPRQNSPMNAFLVSFEQPGAGVPAASEPVERFTADEATRNRLHDLEDEVGQLRTDLSLSHQELDSMREELQAANEELMASNEELQGTNEELQSVNEELYTVNAEYQQKIEELLVSNADLDNFLQSSGAAAVFLDGSLKIRRYTPELSRYVNILPVDLDRGITDLSLPFSAQRLTARLREVMSTGAPHEEELQLADGRVLLSRVMPYLSPARRVDGAVVLFNDVSEYRSAIDALERKERETARAYKLNHVSSWRYESESDRLETDAALLARLGMDSGGATLAAFLQRVDESSRAQARSAFEAALAGAESSMHLRMHDAAGTALELHCEAMPDTAGGGRAPHRLYGIFQDVTERRAGSLGRDTEEGSAAPD